MVIDIGIYDYPKFEYFIKGFVHKTFGILKPIIINYSILYLFIRLFLIDTQNNLNNFNFGSLSNRKRIYIMY